MFVFGIQLICYVWLPIPWFSFFFSWLKCKSQPRCSFIVRTRYLTCVVRGIYWPLILKLGNYFVTISKNILNNNLYISFLSPWLLEETVLFPHCFNFCASSITTMKEDIKKMRKQFKFNDLYAMCRNRIPRAGLRTNTDKTMSV